ncbi:DUF4062 domain-containing protein [Photobacterium iliopiscarium]|jgi:hypothetical protein|uniref:DUF4062 domain-containing protein n=1 Tax=Photobacterium iliopiscarium TaxID=56192 RepID=UPI001E6372C7|nr:DUF4062 domain-containing protein [Photobacterium iliopiscarium]MCD9466772.1 hypothetical protein [Photobacterium iliopiscarium]MCD9486345.1 DUF4062 domain-containing protein [Photobacterium iliopiscarium]MCF2242909.1 DUF4062 domain-containing protein [Photobacterium iliopiscarium]
MAKPRVFVSSTYYDLKHIRADIERFISEFGYDAVLNEKGHIAYGSGESLQNYCYKEISHCDILISIIGGRYGSSSNMDYSVSNQELMTALEQGKQVYIFIDSAVVTEYKTYRANKHLSDISYQAVDDIRIYEFLDCVYSLPKNNTIHEFNNAHNITSFLKEQWAGLFQRLLNDESKKREVDLIQKLSETSDTLNQLVEYLVNEKQGSEAAINSILTTNHPIYREIQRLANIHFRVFFETGEELALMLKALGFVKIENSDSEAKENYSSWKFPNNKSKGIRISHKIFEMYDEVGHKLKLLTPSEWKDEYIEIEDGLIPF